MGVESDGPGSEDQGYELTREAAMQAFARVGIARRETEAGTRLVRVRCHNAPRSL
jgi:hypothetical protein